MRSPRIPLQVILAISDFQNPHFQNKRNCKTVLVKMSFICIRIKKTWMAYQLASLWNKGSAGATWKWLAWHFTQVGIIAGGGGTPGNSWLGCAAWFTKSWTYFRPKHVIFHTRFQISVTCKIYALFSDQKGPKTIPFGTAHNYIAYIREYLPRNNRNF